MNPIQPDAIIEASHFINNAERDVTPADDEGKVVKLESDAKIHANFLPFKHGGTGANGPLNLSGSTVSTIDVGGVAHYELNYTTISITGTAKLAFINPHANGTKVTINVQSTDASAVTISSTATPGAIDVSNMGGQGGLASQASNALLFTTQGRGVFNTGGLKVGGYNNGAQTGQNGVNGVPQTWNFYYPLTSNTIQIQSIDSGFIPAINVYDPIYPAGGGGGSWYGGVTLTGGDGGRGGGALDLNIAGGFSFGSGAKLAAKGQSGTVGTGSTGGHGAGGSIRVRAGSIVSNLGTIDVSSSGNAGQSLIATNTAVF